MQHSTITLLISLVLGILLFYFEPSHAQNHILHINTIGIENGLSSYNIIDIAQDSRGYIWIGTDYGLNRYDGQKIKSYTKEENGLYGNMIIGIDFDSKGMAWIAALDHNNRSTYFVFDPLEEKVFSIKDYLGIDLPFDLKETIIYLSPYRKTIIFNTLDRSLDKRTNFEFNGAELYPILESFDIEKFPDYIFGGNVFRLSEKEYGIIIYPKDITKPNTPHPQIIVVDIHGVVLQTQEVSNKYTGFDFKIAHHQNPFSVYWDPHTTLGNLCIVPMKHPKSQFTIPNINSQLIGSAELKNDKLFLLSPDSLTVYNSQGKILQQASLPIKLSLSHNAFFIDNDENYWVSNEKQLHCLTFKTQFFEQELTHQTPPFKARGIYKRKDGLLYAGTIGSIYVKENKGWKLKNNVINPKTKGLLHNVLSIYEEENKLWLGLEQGQLLSYQLPSWEVERYDYIAGDKGEIPQMMWAMHKSTTGRLWIGTASGLFYLDEKKGKTVPFDPSSNFPFSKSNIWAFYHNKAGTWLCTSSGLYLMDLEAGKMLAHYSLEEKGDQYIPTMQVLHLHEDAEGIFWLATKGDGLIRWNPQNKSVKQYTQNGAGLSHNVLYAVYEDDFGNLWLPSNRGLMAFNKETESVQTYLEEDGIPHNEFNTIAHYQDAEGRLYFGGQNGFIHFHPQDVELINNKTPFCITSAFKQKVDADTLINITSQLLKDPIIKLAPNDKMFNLRFVLLDYNDSKNHQYSYQIVGYEKAWNYLTKGELQINNLPYGNYSLKLRAKPSNSNIWQHYPQDIQILVLCPFYLKWWFLLLSSLCIASLAYLIFRWRIHQLKGRAKELEAIVTKRTAQIEADKKTIQKDKELIEQQSEELKALDKIKSRFFANISHELRTPLTLILGPLSYILEDADAWDRKEVYTQLLTMQRNGKSLMNLIEEILDLSKLEANKLELQKEATPLKQFFELLISAFIPQAETLKLHLNMHLDVTNDTYALVDRKKIEKVVNNFLSNSLKFTPQGGHIDCSSYISNQKIYFEVKDTGKGIHPQDLPMVFERFYQSKQEDQKLYGGTGIGLALVKEFATLMQGEVEAKSELNKGSLFRFSFPLEVVEMVTQEHFTPTETIEEEPIESIGCDFTILVVEDNPDMQAFVCKVLRKKYKEVLTANNGIDGLKILEEKGTDIHLIVSDIMMPELDGWGMVQQIKTNVQWRKIPIIMLTALAAEKDKLQALMFGVDDYLTKPFSVKELLVRGQNLLYNYHQRRAFIAEIESEEPTTDEDLEQENEWVSQVREHVLTSIADKLISVEELAAKMYFSKRQFGRKLKEMTGFSPAKFIREVQLQKAREILETGKFISIGEVAFLAGFENHATFSTTFKSHFGKSPSEYK